MNTEITVTKKNTFQIASLIANGVLVILAAVLAFLYIQATHDVEVQKNSVAALQTELVKEVTRAAELKSDLAKEAARAAELKADLNVTLTTAQSLVEKSNQLQSTILTKEQELAKESAKVESVQEALDKERSRLPVVPVRIEMRNSAMGRGLVAKFTNTSAKQLPLLLAIQNPTTMATKQFTLLVAPGLKKEIGYLEGWVFASGDRVILRSSGFEDVKYIVP